MPVELAFIDCGTEPLLDCERNFVAVSVSEMIRKSVSEEGRARANLKTATLKASIGAHSGHDEP